ncbi:MAG: squalene/phytoene synthase family protein [bacterium]
MFTQYNQIKEELHKILLTAKKRTKEKHPYIYILAQLFFNRGCKEYFFLWYFYFRWVDDIADLPNRSYEEKIYFINSQREILLKTYADKELKEKYLIEEEKYIYYLALFDLQNGLRLKNHILGMFSAIEYDIQRENLIPQKKELYKFIEIEVTSYLNTFLFFCKPKGNYSLSSKPYGGIACKQIHILRDFIEDLYQGWINIPVEDIGDYKIELNYINTPSFRQWVQEKVKFAEDYFLIEKQNLKTVPSLRYKLAVVALFAKYEFILKRIKKNKFYLPLKSNKTNLEKMFFILYLFLGLLKVLIEHIQFSFRNLSIFKH